MSEPTLNALANLQRLSQGDPTVMSFVQPAIESSYKESGLDPKTFMLVRMAALAALDGAPASWLMISRRAVKQVWTLKLYSEPL